MPIINTVTGGGGSKGGKVIDGEFTPSSFPVTYTPPDGFVGWSNLTVLSPEGLEGGNIRKGVTIAGVEGVYDPQPNLQDKTLTPTEFPSSVTYDEGFGGLGTVTVEAPAGLTEENIREGVTIAGVNGTYHPTPNLQSMEVTPTEFPTTIVPDADHEGLSDVTVNAPDGLIAENIVAGKSIAGVMGTYVGPPTDRVDIFNISGVNANAYAWVVMKGIPEYHTSGIFNRWNGVELEMTQDKPARGQTNLPIGRGSFVYGDQHISLYTLPVTISDSSYVGSYWYSHIVEDFPEGDYLVDVRYLNYGRPSTTAKGYTIIRGATMVWGCVMNSSAGMASMPSAGVYNNLDKFELGDIRLDFDGSPATIHLPAIHADLWVQGYSDAYKYCMLTLNIYGIYEAHFT